MTRVLSLASLCLGVALSMPAIAAQTDWSAVDTILARKGAVSGDVHRYGLPRADLSVSLDGVVLKPGFALGGWIALEPMGDLLLTESEINPVMMKLLAEGVQVTALHNADGIKMNGLAVAGAMGTEIGINFQPTGGGKAAITGDFVALASELNPLITALRDGGIEVTAIHNHMAGEEPRAFFVHFWANDDAVKLANGLGAALKTLNVARD